MAVNLLGNYNNISNNTGKTSVAETGSAVQQAKNAIINELRSMMPGDSFIGQLVNKDGNSIQLLLSDNTMLNTILDKDVNIAMGQQISFEVRSNQDGQLTLRPMFTNLSNSSTIMAALDAAGIGAADVTIEMVDTLMKNSMSIGKDMLNTINRELTMYSEADVKDLCMLHKMNIPVNEKSVEQMHLYRNNNQWMMESVDDAAAEGLTDLLTDTYNRNDADIINLTEGLKNILKPALDENVQNNVSNNALENSDASNNTAIVNTSENASVSPGNDSVNISNNQDNININASLTGADNDTPADTIEKTAENTINNINSETVNANADTDIPNSSYNQLNSINKYNVFDKISQLSRDEVNSPEVRALIKNSLTELLKDNFLMNPKDVGEDKYVKKYYERTMDLAKNIESLLALHGKTDTSFGKMITNVKNNTGFMNQINELYNYVQLPLKMNDSHANGDLYVYARKKGRGFGGEDGKLTALLHLSMEHLGNMDIFLTLTDGQKLSTKFCLEKEEMIDFIESHLDMLNERLRQKGYDIGTTVATNTDKTNKNTIDNIIDKDGTNILFSTQSFDARA